MLRNQITFRTQLLAQYATVCFFYHKIDYDGSAVIMVREGHDDDG
jgi:hypothetical protein